MIVCEPSTVTIALPMSWEPVASLVYCLVPVLRQVDQFIWATSIECESTFWPYSFWISAFQAIWLFHDAIRQLQRGYNGLLSCFLYFLFYFHFDFSYISSILVWCILPSWTSFLSFYVLFLFWVDWMNLVWPFQVYRRLWDRHPLSSNVLMFLPSRLM